MMKKLFGSFDLERFREVSTQKLLKNFEFKTFKSFSLKFERELARAESDRRLKLDWKCASEAAVVITVSGVKNAGKFSE